MFWILRQWSIKEMVTLLWVVLTGIFSLTGMQFLNMKISAGDTLGLRLGVLLWPEDCLRLTKNSLKNLEPMTPDLTSGELKTLSCLSKPGCAAAPLKLSRAPMLGISSEKGLPTSGDQLSMLSSVTLCGWRRSGWMSIRSIIT